MIPDVERVVCLGAHPDDIEIAAAGTLLRLAAERPRATFQFLILTGDGERRREAEESARDLIPDRIAVEVGGFRDGLLPYEDPQGAKQWVAERAGPADLVLSPNQTDRHQDHAFVAALGWQLFRGATILEYEIPKWEGDRPDANLYVRLDDDVMTAKVDHMRKHFPSQQGKGWYEDQIFESVARLRGIECSARWAEAFVARKLTWA